MGDGLPFPGRLQGPALLTHPARDGRDSRTGRLGTRAVVSHKSQGYYTMFAIFLLESEESGEVEWRRDSLAL